MKYNSLKHNLRFGFLKFLCAIVLSRLMNPLSKDETTVIKTMFMYLCVWFSWPWGWLQMWPKHVR